MLLFRDVVVVPIKYLLFCCCIHLLPSVAFTLLVLFIIVSGLYATTCAVSLPSLEGLAPEMCDCDVNVVVLLGSLYY